MLRASIALLAILPAFAQELNAIRVNVRLVNVAFTVRDAQGKLVTDLTKDDFEVFDDGQAQPISFFARGEDLPLTLGLIVDFSGSQEQFVKQHQHDLGVSQRRSRGEGSGVPGLLRQSLAAGLRFLRFQL